MEYLTHPYRCTIRNEKRMSNTGKNNNLMESKLEVLLAEVEVRKNVLYGTLPFGISNKRKRSEWESVCEAINAVGSDKCIQAEVKKKWSDIKVDVKDGCRPKSVAGGGTREVCHI